MRSDKELAVFGAPVQPVRALNRKNQVPYAHYSLCTPAPPVWQLSIRMVCPHLLLAWTF